MAVRSACGTPPQPAMNSTPVGPDRLAAWRGSREPAHRVCITQFRALLTSRRGIRLLVIGEPSDVGRRPRRVLFIALMAVATAACVTAGPGQAPSATAMPGADTLTSTPSPFAPRGRHLFLAVGNPDTAEGLRAQQGARRGSGLTRQHEGRTTGGARLTREIRSGREDVAMEAGGLQRRRSWSRWIGFALGSR